MVFNSMSVKLRLALFQHWNIFDLSNSKIKYSDLIQPRLLCAAMILLHVEKCPTEDMLILNIFLMISTP